MDIPKELFELYENILGILRVVVKDPLDGNRVVSNTIYDPRDYISTN